MGKNKKKDPQKKALQRAAKEAKQDRKAAKKLAKEQRKERGEDEAASGEAKRGGANEDDIDAILASYNKRSLELTTPVVEVLGAANAVGGGAAYSTSNPGSIFPSPPRGNFTLTAVPGGELVMFGGEFYDGAENLVFDELFRWDPDAKGVYGDKEEGEDPDHDGVTGVVDDVHLLDINEDINGMEDATKSATKPNPGVWRRILSPSPIPPARCSHTTVCYNNSLYVFGGELATAEKYHHYKDMWRFDLKTNLWTELIPRGGHAPPSRSGHRCIVWRHYMVLFGGFFEALRETRWYDDLWVFDFSSNSWTEMTYSKLATTPPARSAFSFCLSPSGDTAFIYGGYSKLKNSAPGTKSEQKVHSDCWALHLKGIASGRLPTWDRISRRGEYPSLRSSTSCVSHKSKMLIFGGVSDEEQDHHMMRSVFYDDLFAFDMDRRRWFKMGLKKTARGQGRRRKRKDHDGSGDVPIKRDIDGNVDSDDDEVDDDEMEISGVEGEAASSGWDLDKLRANMFAFVDGDGNIVYEKIEKSDGEEDDCSDRELKKTRGVDSMTGNHDDEASTTIKSADVTLTSNSDEKYEVERIDIVKGKNDVLDKKTVNGGTLDPSTLLTPQGAVGTSEVMMINADSGVPEPVAREMPLPRIHAATAVRGSTLYVYGGLLEVGDREMTLDDCWSIDLNRREKWICLWPGSMHKQVWRGVTEDDDSYISTGAGESDDGEEDGTWMLNEAISEEDEDVGVEEGKEKHKKKKEKTRDKIARIREEYDLDDLDRTPELGESMADFYSRTAEHWETRAVEVVASAAKSEGAVANSSADLSAKELKRQGFNMARERYEELKPVLDSLMGLEAHQQEKKVKRASKKADSKKEKKKKDRKSR
mmetsp:Transcript_16016/g.34847  ORF Transcript_16016/g.34847 Transcript_16016/m.34847 type:complete len:872 (-) Transcript_16016:57-2672(-)